MLSRHRRFVTRAVLALMLLACGSLATPTVHGTAPGSSTSRSRSSSPVRRSRARRAPSRPKATSRHRRSRRSPPMARARSLSTYSMDGKDYPITGSAEFESLAAKTGRRVDDRRHAEARGQGGRDDKPHVVEGQENHDGTTKGTIAPARRCTTCWCSTGSRRDVSAPAPRSVMKECGGPRDLSRDRRSLVAAQSATR